MTAMDGHLCLSMQEKIVDDFLHQHGITHEREPFYPPNPELNPRTRLRGDWLLANGTLVEMWGMPNDPMYAARMREKEMLAAKNGIRLIPAPAARTRTEEQRSERRRPGTEHVQHRRAPRTSRPVC